MDKPTFEQQSMFQYQGNHVLKGATFEGKNMLPIGSIFFPLRVAHVRIEYSMRVKLLTEHHLEFLSINEGCTGSSESTLVKLPHCWNHMSPLTS